MKGGNVINIPPKVLPVFLPHNSIYCMAKKGVKVFKHFYMKGGKYMDELRLGKITNIELAEWFGTTEKQISHKKKQFLDKLEDYCVFKPIRGGIEIKIIIKPFYVKNKNYQIAKDQFNNYWSETGLDTCTHVAD